jgi:signal transduction histidine kinase/DNA-binding response OmpR family regulator
MNARLVILALEAETDIVLVRKRARRLAELIGFEPQDQTRITTAVSEIARNALEYAGGGRVEFRLSDSAARQQFEIIVADRGPGITRLDAILDGSQRSATGMGIGLTGAQRLMDDFKIETAPGAGTTVRLAKTLPNRAPALGQEDLKRITQALAAEAPPDLMEEIRRQNQEMVIQLEELNTRQEELTLLNHELHDTNRGVVALYAELDERADHLRRADELKSRFLSNMSHEFRTPLNSILALSRLLLTRGDGELTAEQEKQVQFIRKAAESLTELVNDLLDLAKVEAGKIVVTPIECSADSLFATLRGMLRPLLVGDVVALVFEDPADIPPLLQDEGKLAQILRNFISNAIKFTEQGEVRIWAVYDSDGDSVTFSVRDTGIGIAEEDLDIIFQEFGQVAHPMQRRVKGTGLGLPLSKKLSELLGGSIAVQSAPGEGSVFSVTIPRIYRSLSAPIDIAESWELQSGRIPILAVEDNPADSFAVERILATSRYQAVVARSVAEARRALESVRPAAIILDVVLLGDESWRFLIEIRQRDATADIPVVVASSTGDERKAVNLGADEYLDKPIDPGQLVRLLDRLTGQRSVTHVLLVDDEEVSRYLVRQLLPRGTYDIKEAATGVEGLVRLRDERPDIVLLDLNMPGMNGYEFLERLSAETKIPAIILTSMILDNEQRLRLRDASNIISKSDLSALALTEAITTALAGAEGRARP